MKRLVVVAVSLVVLAVATVSWLFWPRPPRPNLPDPSGRDGSRSSLHPRGGDALLTAKLPEPAGDGVLRGRVVDASGAPVAGATVTATTLPHDNPWQLPCDCVETCDATFGTCGCAHAAKHSVELLERREGEAIPVARTTTDADGRYELRGLAEDDFILWADHPTLGAAVAESPPGEQVAEDLHFGESAVHGQVFDESNRPLPDVRVAVIDGVHARFFETVTAEDGTFQFGPLPDHSRTVVVWDGLRLPVQLRLGPTELDLRVFLAPPRTVSGRVRLDDEPAVGVEVVASTEHLSRRVRAGPDGSFAFPGLPPDDYLLTVRKDLLLVERSCSSPVNATSPASC